MLRGLVQSMVVNFADYRTEQTGQYPACLLTVWRDHLYQPEPLAEAPGWSPGHSFHFACYFPYLVCALYVARTYPGFWKQTVNCGAF